jgi:MYXO-CTERM domain-containing protein
MCVGSGAPGRMLCAAVLCLALWPAWSARGEIVTYASGAAAIYGDPAVYGNTLLFSPTAYYSRCSGQAGVDMVDGLLRVWIECPDSIETVRVEEGGAWFFFGRGSDATTAYVGALAANLVITEVNGVAPLSPLKMIPGTMDFVPASADVGSRTFTAVEPVDTAGWRGTMTFHDVSDALVGTAYEGGRVTGAMLVFDDVLATTSETGTIAFIDKKWVSITTSPEPDGAALLAGAAVLGFIGMFRRRRRPSHPISATT